MKAIEALRRQAPSNSELYQMQRSYHAATMPLLQILIDIESCSAHGIYYSKDGGYIGRRERYTPEAFLLKHQVRQEIKRIRREIFGDALDNAAKP